MELEISMLDFELVHQYQFGDIDLIYLKKDGVYSFTMLPSSRIADIPVHRAILGDTVGCKYAAKAFQYDFPAVTPESMIQYKICGDTYFAQHAPGVSMRNSESSEKLVLQEQQADQQGVVTVFRDRRGLTVTHRVSAGRDNAYVTIQTSLKNTTDQPVKLEYCSSFSLGMLSPFQNGAGENCYKIHRSRSFWSAEGRPECRYAEELGLEMSWQGAGMRSLRFGQRSSMPVKEFFPMVALEDAGAGVLWGAQLSAAGPWQLEVSRIGDFLNISGGQPDREFSGWTRTLQPGEVFSGPEAAVSCVSGTMDDLSCRLKKYYRERLAPVPKEEDDLPLIVNEWCTTWGHPGEKELLPLIDRVRNWGVRYMVMDDGWFRTEARPQDQLGDWVESSDKYPEGLKSFCDKIRERGMIPGVWFEFENVVQASTCCREHPDWLLTLDGEILKVGDRRFLDFRKKEVRDYLDERLIGMLKRNSFGYMKVDYNAEIPGGIDGPDSPAENLRAHLEAVKDYFLHVRRELPDLVLEICASGGHRLSPFWLRLGDMGSFSDAHEGYEIPLVAAGLHQVIPMARMQIWAVIRPEDDERRLRYSLSASFLGRMCLSGNLDLVTSSQEAVIREAISFYQNLKPLVRDGVSHFFQSSKGAWNIPRGYQVFRRENSNADLTVVHCFTENPEEVVIRIPAGREVRAVFKSESVQFAQISEEDWKISGLREFDSLAVYAVNR